MEFKRLSSAFAASPQLSVCDVAAAAAHGFKLIVNNRPDGEEPAQPAAAEIEAAARAAGLDHRHIPISGGWISDADIAALAAAMDEADGPTLAFCRSGMRSTALWALAQAPRMEAGAIIDAARRAGFDLSALRPRLSAGSASQAEGRRGGG